MDKVIYEMNKYRMTREDNILYAKRNIIDSIWKEANIEGIAVTFPETRAIFEGRTVPKISVNDTVAINNLKHGWQFILDTIDVQVDLAYVRQINHLIGASIVIRAGELRMSDVSIGGTYWKPDIPDYENAKQMIEEIASQEAGQSRALDMFVALCRAQLFYDGNKRTAQLVANKMLIEDGAGILAIPTIYKEKFDELLVKFYETNNSEELIEFLDETSLDGFTLPDLDLEKEQDYGPTQ